MVSCLVALTRTLHLKAKTKRKTEGVQLPVFVSSLLPKRRCIHSLLALVLVRTLESIHLDELVERSLDAAAGPNLNGEIEERVEGVGRVVTFRAGDSGTKTTSEELMDRRGILEISVDVPAKEKKGTEEVEEGRGRGQLELSTGRDAQESSRLELETKDTAGLQTHLGFPCIQSSEFCSPSIKKRRNSCESSCRPVLNGFAISTSAHKQPGPKSVTHHLLTLPPCSPYNASSGLTLEVISNETGIVGP